MQELLNIEQLFQRRFNKFKIKYIRKLGQVLHILGSPLKVGFHEGDLVKFRLNVVEIFNFCQWKLIDLFFLTIAIYRIKVVFTLGGVLLFRVGPMGNTCMLLFW
jgi:hypothetical protein